MSITPLPAAPSRSDPPDTFIVKADAFLAALVNMVTEINASVAFGRTVLGANKDYYVRFDGNDANSGLTNSNGGAWLTLQHAIDQVVMLDFNGFTVTIHIADGTYTGAALISQPWVGGGQLSIIGNLSTPANVLFSVTGADAIGVSCSLPGLLLTRGFKVHTITSGSGFRHDGRGTWNFDTVDFGVCAVYHMLADAPGAKLIASGFRSTPP